MSANGVSFVVIAFNEQEAIGSTLAAIDALNALPHHEIIVVDDGSTDRTAERVRTYRASHPCVRLVSQANRGRGAARSAGLSEACLDLVAMVDADVELPTNWLHRCVAALADGADAVGGVAVPEGDSTWIHRVFRLDPRLAPLEQTVTGNNLLSPRAVMDRVGFASELRTAEDVLFVHQLEASGHRSLCIPGLVCIHHEHKGLGRTLAWMFESGISATHQLLRFRPPRIPDVAFFGGLLATVLVSVLVDWTWGLTMLAVWVVGVSAGHVRRSFLLHGTLWYALRWTGACLANVALITTYFLGRIVGFVVPNPIARVRRGSGHPTPT